jgi:hypothetical protein
VTGGVFDRHGRREAFCGADGPVLVKMRAVLDEQPAQTDGGALLAFELAA